MNAADLETEIISAMAADDWDTVAMLEQRLDKAPTPAKVPVLRPSAMWYVHHGLSVFPLQPRSKLPYKGSHGLDDATTDEDLIRYWWQLHPDSNIGLATGHLVDVLDIDRTEGVLSWLHDDSLPKPDEPAWAEVLGVVWTPRARQEENRDLAKGGLHIYVKASGHGNRARIKPGIDFRGLGGYVLAPPSLNVECEPYRWRSALRLPTSGD